jgi:1,4-dihydroxy-2-naphthoyl-CoA hydrolase
MTNTPQPSDNEIVAAMPHAQSIGVALDHATADEVRGHLDWSPEHTTLGGALHGGALMALADSIGAVCAFLNLPPGAATTTVESKTNFFHGVKKGRVRAISRPVHTGRRFITVQTDLYNEERCIGMTVQTQAVLLKE